MIKLIIAEDHQSLIDGLKLHLENSGNIKVVATANDGEELLDLVRDTKPDIALIDIRMPKMDGFQLTKRLKNDFPEIKVVAFTMYDHDEAVRKMIKAGADGYLLKKSSLKEVKKAIELLYEGGTYFDHSLSVPNVFGDNATSTNEGQLTKRQYEILRLMADGLTSREIADKLCIGVYTVNTHRKNMIRILGLKGYNELLRYAMDVKYDF